MYLRGVSLGGHVRTTVMDAGKQLLQTVSRKSMEIRVNEMCMTISQNFFL